MASRERVVEFAVKARDEYSKVLKNLEQQQTKLSAAARATSRRSVVGLAKNEVDAAVANYKRLASEVDRYRAVQANATKTGALSAAEMREVGDTIKLLRDRAREAADAINVKRAALGQLNASAKSGFAAFDRLATSMQRGAVAVTQENSAAAATSAHLNKIASSSRVAAAAQKQLQTATDGATASMNRQRGGTRGARGEAQEIEVWGLKPWQLTNLGYQVNDVVSGLAMGQRPLQILAQQAGQFAQIWPGVMVSLAKSIPVIAGVTAVLSPFIATALRLREVGALNREFSALLNISADGAQYSVQALTEAAMAMQRYGIAADESRELVRKFVRAGLPEVEMTKYAKVAKQLADLMKISTPEAMEKFLSVDGIRELDKELNFLTASQNSAMLAMERTGDVSGALTLAQDALAEKLRSSGKAASEWDQAMGSLSSSWNNLLKSIEDTGLVQKVMRFVAKELSATARDVDRTVQEIKDIINFVSGAGPIDMTAVTGRMRELEEFVETSRILGAMDEMAVDRAKEELAELKNMVIARREEVEAIKDGGAAVTSRVNLGEQIQKQIELSIESLKEEADLAGLTNRELFIEKNTREAINRITKDGISLTEQQVEQVRKSVSAMYDLARANEYSAGKNTGSLADKIIGIEYGNGSKYKNDNSSAAGAGQFIASTWLRMFKQYFPDRAAGLVQTMGDAAAKQYILDLRKDQQLSKTMVELYIKENSAILQKAGIAVNDASVYLAHFLGGRGAEKLLKAAQLDPSTPTSKVLSADALASNPTVLQGKTVGEVVTWSQQKVALDERQLAIATQMGEQGEKYLHDYRERVTAQQFELDLMVKTAREAAIAKALRDEELKAKEAGVALTAEMRAETERLAAAEFDRKNVNEEVNKLIEKRSALFESLQIATLAGDQGKIADTITQIQGVEEQLQSAIDKAIAFWEALGGPGAEAAIANLRNIRDGIGQTLEKMEKQFLPTAIELNEQMADIGGNAFSAFAQAIANGENAAQAFFDTLLQGIADFLIEIGKAIVKQALFNAISGAGGAGGIGGTIGGWISSIFHEGGVIGRSAAPARMVNPAIFSYAQRRHTGGLAGLKSGEVPIIAMRDEEVLTTDDPRHTFNGGGRSAVNVKNVNVFDPIDVLEAALATVPGERVVMNWLTRNSRKVNGALNGT